MTSRGKQGSVSQDRIALSPYPRLRNNVISSFLYLFVIITTEYHAFYCMNLYSASFCCSIIGMDVHTIIDSISDVMRHEDKDLAKTGELAMQILLETTAVVLGSRLKVCNPFL